MDKCLAIIRWVGGISLITGTIAYALYTVRGQIFKRPMECNAAWIKAMSFITLSTFAFISHEVIVLLTKEGGQQLWQKVISALCGFQTR